MTNRQAGSEEEAVFVRAMADRMFPSHVGRLAEIRARAEDATKYRGYLNYQEAAAKDVPYLLARLAAAEANLETAREELRAAKTALSDCRQAAVAATAPQESEQ